MTSLSGLWQVLARSRSLIVIERTRCGRLIIASARETASSVRNQKVNDSRVKLRMATFASERAFSTKQNHARSSSESRESA